MNTVSLFSGCGGLDIGVSQAGGDIVCCVDTDIDSIESLKKNQHSKNAAHLNLDVSQLSASQILAKTDYKNADIDFVVGGPPCQSFSKNNYWTKSGEESLRRKKRMKQTATANGREFIGDLKLTKARKRVDVHDDLRTSLVMEYARLIGEFNPKGFLSVSYTHLTLPTILLV